MPRHQKLRDEKGNDEERIRLFPDINRGASRAAGLEFSCGDEQQQRKHTENKELNTPIPAGISIAVKIFKNNG